MDRRNDSNLTPTLRKSWEKGTRVQYLTNDEVEKFCAANGVTDPNQRAAVHDAVRAMEQAEGKMALARMHDSMAEEQARFLDSAPDGTYTGDSETDQALRFQKALFAAQKIYEETLCNQTLRATLQVMMEMDYTREECNRIEQAARFRMQLRP